MAELHSAPKEYIAPEGHGNGAARSLERLMVPTLDGTRAIIIGRFLFVADDAPREAELAVVITYAARHGLPASAVAVSP